ncbi:hypothetical protein BCM20_000665 [Clostridium beijerinckii]|nr:hypothetical protein [Clostridium beijerinckii]NYC00710.1 hypothetical protein [Clostridium beijerinckii]
MYYDGAKLDGIGPACNSECDLLNQYADTIITLK